MNKAISVIICMVLSCFYVSSLSRAQQPGDSQSYSSEIKPFSPDEAKHEQIKFENGVKNQALIYAAVKTLEFQATCVNPPYPNYSPRKLHIFFDGTKYAYEYVRGADPSKPRSILRGAYDGTTRQELDSAGGYLETSKKDEVYSNDLWMRNYLFLPYMYFAHEDRGDLPGMFLRPPYLADPARWQDFIANVKLQGTATLSGRQVVVGVADFAKEAYTTLPGKARFYFNPQANYYPVGWDAVNASGRLLQFYRITDLGLAEVKPGIQLPYPKSARLDYFFKDGTDIIVDKPENWQIIKLTSIKVNQAVPENAFTIDPTFAPGILDEDTGAFTRLPNLSLPPR